MQRRVVVTGVGLVTSVGIGTETVWEAIKKGANGIDTITSFDAAQFSCRIAGEVKGFDPANYIEKKEIKKMGRFIQFAIPAADFAVQGGSDCPARGGSSLRRAPESEQEVPQTGARNAERRWTSLDLRPLSKKTLPAFFLGFLE